MGGSEIELLPQKGKVGRGAPEALEPIEVTLQLKEDSHDTLAPAAGPADLPRRPVVQ